MAKKTFNNNSVGFAEKYKELKALDPFKLLEKKRTAFFELNEKCEAARKEYWEMEDDIINLSEAYTKKISTELKPLARTMQDHLDIMTILD